MRRTPAEGLGIAGGLAFFGRLPGIESEALFDEISVRPRLGIRTGSARSGRVWKTGRSPTAPRPTFPRPGPPRLGGRVSADACRLGRSVRSEVIGCRRPLSAHGGVTRRSHVRWSGTEDPIPAGFTQGRGAGCPRSKPRTGKELSGGGARDSGAAAGGIGRRGPAPPPPSLDRRRPATGHRLSGPMFLCETDETEGERRARANEERRYFEKEEASIRRAQNLGRRIAGPDGEGVWVPGSYSLNRALVLESHERSDPIDGNDES